MKKIHHTKIVSTRSILGGKPRIDGTRISVDIISHYITNGGSVFEIKQNYPHLSNEQISTALNYIEERAIIERGRLEPTAG